jgi:replicative DNA helicase
MFIHREEMYKRDDPKFKGKADILISKHRNGRVGSVELAWVENIASFDNLDAARIRRSVGE